jgi:hypothetical protein
MKILVTLAVDVDPQEWDEVYGNGSSPAEVRADIRSYILNHVQESAGMEDTSATVSLR